MLRISFSCLMVLGTAGLTLTLWPGILTPCGDYKFGPHAFMIQVWDFHFFRRLISPHPKPHLGQDCFSLRPTGRGFYLYVHIRLAFPCREVAVSVWDSDFSSHLIQTQGRLSWVASPSLPWSSYGPSLGLSAFLVVTTRT